MNRLHSRLPSLRTVALCAALALPLMGLWAGTQAASAALGHHPALGGLRVGSVAVHAPWALLSWLRYPQPALRRAAARGLAVFGGSVLLSVGAVALLRRPRPPHVRPAGEGKWATLRDMRRAGLLTGKGTVVGDFAGRLLTYDGPEHQLVAGASRSGKGVGHVIPTVLNWPASALVYDVKGEVHAATAGFRSRFSRCLRFDPTAADTHRFNPLFEVRKGEDEVRDAQNVVDMLVNPTGEKRQYDVWDQNAAQLLTAVVLHVLYAEPDTKKNLGTVRERVMELEKTCYAMMETPHVVSADGDPAPHPEAARVARELLTQPPKFQASVRGTALGYLTLFADPKVCRATAASDFRLADLACDARPVTLYLQPPPSDADRLRPLVRLMVNQLCRTLMERPDRDGRGRKKNHRVLLMLDEFPTLGRLEFFAMSLRQMAGYGLKAHLVVQSFNDITEHYGPANTVVDNCHVLVAFASADTATQQRVSQMTGTVTEYREGYSRPSGVLGGALRGGRGSVSLSEQVRPLLHPGEVRELPGGEQLVFVTGFPPMRTAKVRYYDDPRFAGRLLPPPGPGDGPDAPPTERSEVPSEWLGEGPKGERQPYRSADLRGEETGDEDEAPRRPRRPAARPPTPADSDDGGEDEGAGQAFPGERDEYGL